MSGIRVNWFSKQMSNETRLKMKKGQSLKKAGRRSGSSLSGD